MQTSKPLASLTPKLLARKGGAKPAMRPQVAALGDPLGALPGEGLTEDLGWNDFGEESGMTGPTVVSIRSVAKPAVRRRPRGSALAQGGRSAFTLRLDAERHLRLRLACTLDDRSAQALVTDALDRLLADMPEIDGLAKQVSKRRKT